MSVTRSLTSAMAYADFSNEEVETAVKGYIAQLDADLTEVGFEPSEELESSIEALDEAMGDADALDEEIAASFEDAVIDPEEDETEDDEHTD